MAKRSFEITVKIVVDDTITDEIDVVSEMDYSFSYQGQQLETEIIDGPDNIKEVQ